MARLIGVFGGTFDPPHIGHLILADSARAVYDPPLEKILWVLAADPPHKIGNPITPVDIRVEMVLAAIAGSPHFAVSKADMDRPGPHYSVDMLEWLRQRITEKIE